MIVGKMRSQTSRSHQNSRQVRSAGSRFWRYGPLIVWAILIFVGSGNILSAAHTSILLLAIAYALTDEFHQSFVPSRTASIYDSLIDSVGALIGLTIIWLRLRKSAPDRKRASARNLVS